jgi:hypothetical protein
MWFDSVNCQGISLLKTICGKKVTCIINTTDNFRDNYTFQDGCVINRDLSTTGIRKHQNGTHNNI